MLALAVVVIALPASAVTGGARAPPPSATTSSPLSTSPSLPGERTGAQPRAPEPASLYNQFNTTWGGYVLCVARDIAGQCAPGNASTAGDDAVHGTWNLTPVASTLPASQSARTFAGIGGYGTTDLIAAGTEVTVGPSTSPSYSAYWQMAPGVPQVVTLAPTALLSPGDFVSVEAQLATVQANGSQSWTFTVSDATTRSSWSGTELCALPACDPSSFDSAEWVEAVPPSNGSPLPPPAFAQFDVYGEYQVNGSTSWSSPYNGITLDLVNPAYSTGDLVLTSGLEWIGYGGSQFYLCYLLDGIDLSIRGARGTLSPTIAGPGGTVTGRYQMEAPDGFSPSGVADLALDLWLSTGTANCTDPIHGLTDFPGSAGTANYTTNLTVCPGLPSGRFPVEALLYYVPSGGSPGGPGSLLLATSGYVFPTVQVVDFITGAVALSPLSGTIDAGDRLSLSVNVTPIGAYSGPYSVSFVGGPPGCGITATLAGPNFSLGCDPQAGGTYRIAANVSVPNVAYWSDGPAAAPYTILPAPVVTIRANLSALDLGMSVAFTANASGGDGTYRYAWRGLPIGCTGGTAAQFLCSPTAPGNYSIQAFVTDGTGLTVNSTAERLTVAPALETGVTASPAAVRVGGTIALAGTANGGVAPYRFAWSGLPAGCPAANSSQLRCPVLVAGSFQVRFTATDAFGRSNASTVTVLVGPSEANGSPYAPSVVGWTVFAATGAAVAGFVAWLVRDRRRPR